MDGEIEKARGETKLEDREKGGVKKERLLVETEFFDCENPYEDQRH